MRAFIAFTLPEKIKNVLGSVKDHFELSSKSLKWVDYGNFHITIKFLGNIREESLPGIISVISAAGKKFSSIAVKINRLDFFPNAKNPRVFFAGIDKETALKKIVLYIENELNSLGFTESDKVFKTHITLARFKSRGDLPLFQESLKTVTFKEAFNIENIGLYQSTLRPTGPVYEKIFTASLNR